MFFIVILILHLCSERATPERRSSRLSSVKKVDYTEVGAGTSWSEQEKEALASLLVEQDMDPSYMSEASFKNLRKEGKVKYSIIVPIHPLMFSQDS